MMVFTEKKSGKCHAESSLNSLSRKLQGLINGDLSPSLFFVLIKSAFYHDKRGAKFGGSSELICRNLGSGVIQCPQLANFCLAFFFLSKKKKRPPETKFEIGKHSYCCQWWPTEKCSFFCFLFFFSQLWTWYIRGESYEGCFFRKTKFQKKH